MAYQNKSKLLTKAYKTSVNWPIYLSNLVTITTPYPVHTKPLPISCAPSHTLPHVSSLVCSSSVQNALPHLVHLLILNTQLSDDFFLVMKSPLCLNRALLYPFVTICAYFPIISYWAPQAVESGFVRFCIPGT